MHQGQVFEGPIFIVGLPRSGTKLLRTLMNNHSLIEMPGFESNFIPYFYHKFQVYGDCQNLSNFKKLYSDLSRTKFFNNVISEHHFIDMELWYDEVTNWSYAGIIEAYYKLYTKSKNKKIWGDKTPGYMNHITLLHSLFPKSKFIHIIRDVRDYCLSINKAWNKNTYRAAQRWVDAITKTRIDVKSVQGIAYFEIHYENLVNQPEKTLKTLFSQLGLEYEVNMTMLSKPSENLGDARNHTKIMSGNFGKWKKELPSNKLRKIENISGNLLLDLNYVPSTEFKSKRLSNTRMFYYKILDGLNYLIFEIRVNGFGGGLHDVFNSISFRHHIRKHGF